MNDNIYKIAALLIFMMFGIGTAFAFEQAPSSINLNSRPPIHTGSQNQSKIGALTLNTSANPNLAGLLVPNGSVGFGTLLTNPKLNMHVAGKIGADAFCDRQNPTPNCVSIPRIAGSLKSVVLMFEKNCPQNWTLIDEMKGRFARGNNFASIGQTGGSDAPHRHTLQINRTGPDFRGGGNRVPTEIDPAITDYRTILPPYLNVIFCKYAGS